MNCVIRHISLSMIGALSILHASSAFSQTPVKDCLSIDIGDDYKVTNNCEYAVRTHYNKRLDGTCIGTSMDEIPVASAMDHPAPGMLCLDYEDEGIQRNSGYRACPAIGCGSGGLSHRFGEAIKASVSDEGGVVAATGMAAIGSDDDVSADADVDPDVIDIALSDDYPGIRPNDPDGGVGKTTLDLSMREGENEDFWVVPNKRPSGNMHFEVTVSPSTGLTIDTEPRNNFPAETQGIIRFNRHGGTYAQNNFRKVVITADRDNDVDDETFTITITGHNGGYGSETATVTVNVTDADVPGDIVLSDTGLMEVMEGGSMSRSVSLRLDQGVTALKSDATISLASERSNITISPKTFTFTSSNYTTAQTFSVVAVEDADYLVDFDEVTLTASVGIVASPVNFQVVIDDNDSPPVGSIVLSDGQTAPISEGDSTTIGVSLSRAPTGRTRVSLSSDIPQAIVSPASLFFTPANYSIAQMVSIMALEDDDATDETASITIEVTTQGVEGGFSAEPVIHKISIVDNDKPEPPPQVHNYDGTLIVVPEAYLEIDEGGEGVFDMRLSAKPNGDVSVRVAKVSDTLGITHDRNLLTFTPLNWNEDQSIKIIVHEDKDANDIIHTYSFAFENQRLLRDVIVNDTALGSLQAQALALPPPRGGDEATLRIRCRQDTPCAVDLDCSAQADGTIYRGRLPEPIPKNGARSYTAQQITELMGWETWEGKGRLECLLRGDANISAQVWTRSGAGVLVNNSAMIRSVRNVGIYRADIESIPSPDSPDESNIRIRCNSGVGDCLDTLLLCYLDDGRRLARWHLGRIERLTTRHIQSEELASNILYRWEGMGLGCEVSSKGRFTVQVLTRTGGGGALVNNSATGGG